ncbi:MAG TPA: nucleoside triphosphate pyrophosphohydrolase [Ktedonobacterales bacterium]|nr:nucleoside triphosphate pyrophosphohydrolase [Ktedonobacterales bacterium]
MATAPEIVVVGLGPGRWDDLTLEAQRVLEEAPRILCRTLRHPTIEALLARRPDVMLESFDELYESAESFAALYPTMAERLLALAAQAQDLLIYAVPGHPLLGEESVRRLRLLAAERSAGVRIVPGLSFVEPVCAALGLDPLERNLQLLDATLLADTPSEAMMGVLQPTTPALVAQMYSRRLASAVKLALSEVYPEDWQVTVVRWAGLPGAETLERIPLVDLDRGERADHLTTLYVPPLDPLQAVRVPEGLRHVVARLRAPDGCPWDREQTHHSLRRFVLEEAYEVAEVLDEWDGSLEVAEQLTEELGDLMLQVYLQAEIADQEDLFHLGDVYQAVTEKLIRRHPHVFGDVQVRDSAHVLRNWEEIKRAERTARGEEPAVESVLRGIPKSAPALYQAYELGHKAAKAGFDWPTTDGVLEKISEEARELVEAVEAGTKGEVEAELGDLLFVLARLADHLGLQPEDALHVANMRFKRRFTAMEERARHEGHELNALSLDEWLVLWDEAKAGDENLQGGWSDGKR